MKRFIVILLLPLVFFLWKSWTVSAQFSEAEVKKLEKPIDAPDFTLKVLGSGEISLNDLRGKVVLLNFFSVFCRVCQKEVPSIDKLGASFKDKDLVILHIATDGSEKELKEFKEKYHIPLPILIDENGREAKAYGVRGFHKTFFINREGKIVAYTYAEKDWTSSGVKNLIKLLLNERK
jgi:peroxiredoxin